MPPADGAMGDAASPCLPLRASLLPQGRRGHAESMPLDFSSISPAPLPPEGGALGRWETRHHGSVPSAQSVLTPASPKLELWLYFVRGEGEVKLHRSSPPGVSQDEGVHEVCSVRRPRGCGPWGILLRRRRGQGKKLQDGATDKLEACLMGQTQAMGGG